MAYTYNEAVRVGFGTAFTVCAAGAVIAIFNGGRLWQVILGSGISVNAAAVGLVFYYVFNQPASKMRAETYFQEDSRTRIWILVNDNGQNAMTFKNMNGGIFTHPFNQADKAQQDLRKDFTRLVFSPF